MCAVAGGAIPDIPDIPAFKAAPSPPVMSRECPYIDEGRSSAWPGNVQVTAVFPGWRKGATATIRLGGSVYGIQQCWNTEGSPRVSGGALSFQLGGGTPGLDGQSVGCILDGDMAGNAAPTNELEIEYDVEAGGDAFAADDVDPSPRRLERRPQAAERRVPGGNEGGGATGTASRPLAT